jgi:hypothetical protein
LIRQRHPFHRILALHLAAFILLMHVGLPMCEHFAEVPDMKCGIAADCYSPCCTKQFTRSSFEQPHSEDVNATVISNQPCCKDYLARVNAEFIPATVNKAFNYGKTGPAPVVCFADGLASLRFSSNIPRITDHLRPVLLYGRSLLIFEQTFLI